MNNKLYKWFCVLSDEIMNFSLLEQNSGIKVTIFNDISNSLYDIIVYANEFEILK